MWTEKEQIVSHAVVFKKPNGQRVLINLAKISAVEEDGAEALITLHSHFRIRVSHTFDDVMGMMQVTLKPAVKEI